MVFKYNALSFIDDGDNDNNDSNHWITRDAQLENTSSKDTQLHEGLHMMWYLGGCC